MYNHRNVVPKSLQKETLQKLHEGEIERCRARAISSYGGREQVIKSADCPKLYGVCQECYTSQGTSDSDQTARLSMAGGRDIFI